MVERVAHGVLDDARRLRRGQAVLGLADEFRLAHEDREQAGGRGHHVVRRDDAGALVAGQLGIGLEAAGQRGAEAGLVGAAVAGRNRVAVGADEALAGEPGDRPFRRAVAADLVGAAGKDRHHSLFAAEFGGEEFRQAAGEVEAGLLRNVLAGDEVRRARPADLDAAEEIGLGARHGEQALGPEGNVLAEDLRVGLEADARAAAVVDIADFLQPALGRAAREDLAIELAPARHLDLKRFRQRIDHRHADAVQAAGGVVDPGVELSAGVEGGHDHLQRRLVLELGMRIDRNAAAVVGDGDEPVGFDLDLDPARVTGDRLVHAVVDDLGEEMVQALLVGAADIHARPPAHRLQPLQHLDVGRRIAVLGADRLLQRHRLLAPGGAGDGLQPPDLLVELGEKVGGLVGFAFLGGGHWGRSQSRIICECSLASAPAAVILRESGGAEAPRTATGVFAAAGPPVKTGKG